MISLRKFKAEVWSAQMMEDMAPYMDALTLAYHEGYLADDIKGLFDYALGGTTLSTKEASETIQRVLATTSFSALTYERSKRSANLARIPDVDSPLARALRAATARVQWESGSPVTPRYLADYLNVHPPIISRLVEKGVLDKGTSGISPKSVREYVAKMEEERKIR